MLRSTVLCLALPLVLPSSGAWPCDDSTRTRYEPRSFLGYACDDDCRRHKAGFLWAEQRAVRDAMACEPLESPESDGCRAYVDESFDAGAAGDRWVTENEIADPCLCDGAGERFRAGCVDAASIPSAGRP